MKLLVAVVACLMVLGGVCERALGQDDRGGLGSLDSLLGLDDDGQGGDDGSGIGDALVDPSRAELDRKLTAEEAHEKFAQAVAQMGDAAARLIEGGDAGVATQRLGESILKKLDQVIASAEEQESSSSSSSSKKQQQQQQQQQQAQQQQGRPEQQGTPNPEGAQDGPSLKEGELGAVRAGGSAAWGRLPARTRDALVEGLSDRYSALYERMTEAYYRRLAEDGR
jgi:hypothetical protein